MSSKFKIIGLAGAVESFQMWDDAGNACAAALFKVGVHEFDLYLWRFNDAVPIKYRGTIGLLKASMEAFHRGMVDAGFIEPQAIERIE